MAADAVGVFFSLSNGKLPTYILPCLLPLALLLGHALADHLKLEQGRVLGINGLLNLTLGLITLITLVWLQLKKTRCTPMNCTTWCWCSSV